MATQDKDEQPVSEELRQRILREEQLKALSQPFFRGKGFWLGVVAPAVIGTAVIYYAAWDDLRGSYLLLLLPAGVVTALYAFLIGLALLLRVITRARLEQTHTRHLTLRSEALQETLGENFFTNLVKINFTHIDKYYSQTQIQANKSFILSTVAAVFSFFIIMTGIAMMFWGFTEPSYVTTAAGVLGQFVSAVFFYLYNRTITKMGVYHQKLVLTQNISLALKITEELPEGNRAASRERLIEHLTKDINMYLTSKVEET